MDSSKCLHAIENAHTLNVADIAVNEQNAFVYSGSRDYSVKGWDTTTGKCIAEFSAPRNIVTTLALPPGASSIAGSLLFQGAEDLCVRVWDIKSNSKQPSMHLKDYIYFPISMSLHPTGYYMATGCKGFNSVGCEVKIWDLRSTSKPLTELRGGHSQDVTGVCYSETPSNKGDDYHSTKLVSISKDGSINIWDSNNEPVAGLPTAFGQQLTSVAVGPPGDEFNFIVSAFDGSLSSYTLEEKRGKGQATIQLTASTKPFIT